MAGEVLWRDTGIPPKIFMLDARAIFSPGFVAISLGLLDGGSGHNGRCHFVHCAT